MLSHLSWAYVLGGILFSSLAQVCLKRATAYEGNWFWWIVLMDQVPFLICLHS